MTDGILTLNAGSSSLKFAVYRAGPPLEPMISGQVENVGLGDARLSFVEGGAEHSEPIEAAGPEDAMRALRQVLEPRLSGMTIAGIGHRIVHGGLEHAGPVRLTDPVLHDLARYIPMAPLHQPFNLAVVEAARHMAPTALHVGCFDTAFHRSHPWVNDTFALPRRFYDAGIRRFGFHGLSYEYVMGELGTLDPEGAQQRVVVAHLGNGASICALQGGRSIGSTMGFTSLDGLPMGTRCGQLDPGVVLYLIEERGMTASEVSALLHHESGMKGLSGISHDMRVLLGSEEQGAREALEYYVYRVRREIGAMATVLEGIDTLVFCGGVGENAAPIRDRICKRLGWLGISLDSRANQSSEGLISTGAVKVRVIRTNEELVIARSVQKELSGP